MIGAPDARREEGDPGAPLPPPRAASAIRYAGRLLGVLALAGGAVVALFHVPWRCPLLWGLGVPCPSCGLVRASRALLAGDLAHAHALHPLASLVVGLGMVFGIAEAAGFVREGRCGAVRSSPLTGPVLVVVAGLMAAVWLARFAGAFGGPVGR